MMIPYDTLLSELKLRNQIGATVEGLQIQRQSVFSGQYADFCWTLRATVELPKRVIQF